MNDKIEQILEQINDLDDIVWRLYGKAVQHKDNDLMLVVGELIGRHERIFQALAELKKHE